jgi:hypothetical protein
MVLSRAEIYVATKEGTFLLHLDVLNMETKAVDENLVTGFLSAVNSFAKDMNWPSGVSLIRSGPLECRLSSGEFVFTALIFENSTLSGTNSMLESTVSCMASDINKKFEDVFHDKLIEGLQKRMYGAHDFDGFTDEIINIIDEYGKEINELYFKLICIDAIYARVPQKWILPLMARVGEGESIPSIYNEFPEIIKKYPQFIRSISTVNNEQRPIWDLFGIELYDPEN